MYFFIALCMELFYARTNAGYFLVCRMISESKSIIIGHLLYDNYLENISKTHILEYFLSEPVSVDNRSKKTVGLF